jgi:vancomycin resistance protein YoaR
LVFLSVGAAALAGGAGFAEWQYEPKVAPGTTVAGLELGGLTRDDAAEKLKAWWAVRREEPVRVSSPYVKGTLPSLTASGLGLDFSVAEQLDRLPFERLFESVARQIKNEPIAKREVEPVPPSGGTGELWAKKVDPALPKPSPARATWKDGAVVRQPEVPGLRVDGQSLVNLAAQAVLTGEPITLPVIETNRRVPDDELAKIVEVVSSFATNYSEGNRNRSYNIRLAARKINGTVLMPGEKFSFNGTLGRRTAEKGFLEAGVYVSGRRDTDIGGGICQVSTTLYNAALLAGFDIVARSPHSLTVPYVPLGRDAAVSYPNPDLAFVNTSGQAVAIAAEAGNGKIRFSVLGTKVPGQEIEISQSGHRSWSRGVKYVDDPSLPPGKQRVEEKGGLAHSVSVTRIFKQDGNVVRREDLGVSRYIGGQQIIAVNRRAPAPQPPKVTPVSTGDDASAVTPGD